MSKALLATVLAGGTMLGAVYYQDGSLDRVMPSSKIGISLFGGDDAIERDAVSEAKALLMHGKYDEAVQLLSEEERKKAIAEERKPGIATRLYAEGVKRFEGGDLPTALKLLQSSFRFDSSRSDTCFQLAKAYMKTKRYRMAASYFGQTMRLLDPDRAFEFIEMNEATYFRTLPKGELERVGADLCEVGRRLHRKKQDERALNILRKALHYKEDQMQAHQTLAVIYTARKDQKRAQYHQKRYAELFESGMR